MRIGCLQFAPQVGDVNNNLNRADAVLNRADPDGLDLLVLPEMAFSGYNFKSLSEIAPFLEHSGSGISSLWARTVALKYDCTVIVGYPEKVDPTVKWPTGPEYYNAAIVVNGDGETVANYRKTHLYMTDEKWALENPAGFYNGFLIGLGRTAIGICMDLNPYKFEAPWHAFEFAFHVLEMDANLVVLTMAWMTREDGRMFSRMPQEPDMDTLAYWVTRLEPIIRSDNEDEIIVVFANRTGIEDEAVYAGTSAVLGIKDGEVRVYGILGRGDKELLVVDTENSPYAQLIHRPDGHVVPADGASSLHRSPVDPKKKPFDEHENNENAPEGGTAPRSGSGSLSGHASSSGSSKRSAKAVNGTHSARRKGRNGLSLQTDTARMQNHKETSPTVKTPTCPSPTPISLRPRLTIPPAPSLTMKYLDSQVPSPYPMALHPAPSETQTVLYTENQLTPYPGSHPHSQQGNMPGGHSYGMANGVAANSPQKSMSHFSDSSPASPQLYWMPPSKLLHSPTKSRGWTPTGSDGTAFSETGSTSNRGHPHPSATNLTHYRVDSQPARAKPKQRHSSVDLASKPAGAPGTPADGQQASADSEQLPDRPASPKSRNASRSRGPERPGSAVDASTNLEEISVKLGEIAKRVSSVQGRGTPKQVNGGPVLPDGVTDRQLLEEMRDQRDDNASRQSIPIAACLSIWEDAQIGSAPPNGNGHDRLTNGLPTSTAGQPSQPSGSSLVRGRDVERPPSRANNWQPSSGPTAARTVSRGRQPQASHSTPPRANGQNGHTSGTGSRPSGSREPIDLSQFQLIEEYRSPDCPLHGVRSQSATQSNESPQPPRRRTSNGPPRRIISQSPPHRPTPPDRAQTSAPAMASVDSVLRPATGPAHPSQSYVPDFSMSVESVNSSNPSPKTPFEPQTPKAMKLVFDDQSAPIMEMGLKCVEAVTEIGISRPKSAVW